MSAGEVDRRRGDLPLLRYLFGTLEQRHGKNFGFSDSVSRPEIVAVFYFVKILQKSWNTKCGADRRAGVGWRHDVSVGATLGDEEVAPLVQASTSLWV